VLRRSFERKDVDVVAFYKQTCDGVPDLAAELKKVVARHKLDYTVLNLEVGKISDPTAAKYSWAPYAFIADRQGRVVQEYGHMPSLESLRNDLEILLATGRIPSVPGAGWRASRLGAWVQVRVEAPGEHRLETRKLKKLHPTKVVLDVEVEHADGRRTKRQESIKTQRPFTDDSQIERKELKPATLTIDGKPFHCRVIEASWVRKKRSGEKLSLVQRSWIAKDPTLPDTLLRQETTERSAGGALVKRTRRIRTFAAQVEIGEGDDERQVTCWVVESSAESKTGLSGTRRWHSRAVPGQEVKRSQRIVSNGQQTRMSATVIDFAAKK
jgi:hypothetical protein